MNAPDKIYMPNELLSEEWQRHIEGQDTEYVCKDMLVEWLKEKMTDAEELADDSRNPIHLGVAAAYGIIIAKLLEL